MYNTENAIIFKNLYCHNWNVNVTKPYSVPLVETMILTRCFELLKIANTIQATFHIQIKKHKYSWPS